MGTIPDEWEYNGLMETANMICPGDTVKVMWANGAGYCVFAASEWGGFTHVASFEFIEGGVAVPIDLGDNFQPNAVDEPTDEASHDA